MATSAEFSYLAKLKVNMIPDPYLIPDTQWENSPEWPLIEQGDIFVYLIERNSNYTY